MPRTAGSATSACSELPSRYASASGVPAGTSGTTASRGAERYRSFTSGGVMPSNIR